MGCGWFSGFLHPKDSTEAEKCQNGEWKKVRKEHGKGLTLTVED